MSGYFVESSRVVHEGDFSRVRLDDVRMPDGAVHRREVVEHPGAVAVVPLHADGQVTLLRQYRHALRTRMLEAPAGKLDLEGEAPEAAARRELAEEVGLAAEHWRLLICFHNSAGWTDEHTYVYLATGLRQVAVPHGFIAQAEEADVELLRVPIEGAVAMIHSGEITDAKTVIGLLLTAQARAMMNTATRGR